MITGVVLARAGSKRLPGKNLKPLGGKPLVEWTFDVASRCKRLDEWVITSDSEEILVLGESYGGLGIMRPEELAADTARSEDAALHAMEQMGRTGEGELIVLLQPTSPLRSTYDIEGALSLYRRKGVPAVVSVGTERRPNGAVYVISYETLNAHGTFYPPGWARYDMPQYRSVDIDDLEDWREAERLLEPQMVLDWDG